MCRTHKTSVSGSSEYGRSSVHYPDHRHRKAEGKVAALEATLTAHNPDQPDAQQYMQAEADARQRLAEAQSRLERLETVFGPTAIASSTPDIREMVRLLQDKEQQLQRVELRRKQEAEVSNSPDFILSTQCPRRA